MGMDDLPPMVILDKLPSEKSPPQIGHGVVGELDFGEPRWLVTPISSSAIPDIVKTPGIPKGNTFGR